MVKAAPDEKNGTGLFIGTFDMVTKGHVLTVIAAARKVQLKRIVVSFNHNTSKNPKASILEREKMLQLAFADYEKEFDFKIIPEPIEGRLALGNYLHNLYGERVVGIFGSDTLAQNYSMFFGEKYFELAEVKRLELTIPEIGLESLSFPGISPNIDLPIDTDPLLIGSAETKIHTVEAPPEAEGLSSSLGRKLVLEGARPEELGRVLPTRVIDFIKKNDLYAQRDLDPSEINKDFEEYKKNLYLRLNEYLAFNPIKIDEIPLQNLEGTQSLEAIRDVYVRSTVESIERISPHLHYLIRRLSDEYFKRPKKWEPLIEYKKTGFYMGSFDFINSKQIETIEHSLEQLGLDRIIVAVFDESPNPKKNIKHDLPLRLKNTIDRLQKRGLESKVIVAPVPGNKIEATLRNLSARHAKKISIILGENVFDRMSKRLRGVSNIELAIVPFSKEGEIEIPQNVQRVRLNYRSLQCKGVFK